MQIPVCMYHGPPEHRAELRRTSMVLPRKHATQPKKKAPKKASKRTKKRHPTNRPDTDSDEEVIVVELTDDEDVTTQKSTFPVVVTTYEMIIKDRKHLARYDWGQVIVDEGHRLKNTDSILMREIKKYPSAGRLLLTGTPLHVSSNQYFSYIWPHEPSRITCQSSGLCSTSSYPKFSTMSPPSKTRRLLPLHIINFSFYRPTGSKSQPFLTVSRNRAIPTSSTNCTRFSAHSFSGASKQTSSVHFRPRRSTCCMRR